MEFISLPSVTCLQWLKVSSAVLGKIQPRPFLWQLCSLQRSLMHPTLRGAEASPYGCFCFSGCHWQWRATIWSVFATLNDKQLTPTGEKCLTDPLCAWSTEPGCLATLMWRNGCRLKQLFVLEESGSDPGLLDKMSAITLMLLASFSTCKGK